jgi:hypothetical protein
MIKISVKKLRNLSPTVLDRVYELNLMMLEKNINGILEVEYDRLGVKNEH